MANINTAGFAKSLESAPQIAVMATLRSIVSLSSVLFVIVAVIVYKTFRSYRRLAHIPGPALSGWSYLPWLKWIYDGSTFDKYYELSDKYGSLVRIAPNVVITTDADLWQKMHAVRSPYKRADWYEAARFADVNNLLSERDEERHADLRSRLAAGYGGRENPNMEAVIDLQVQELVKLIERKYLSTKDEFRPMDLSEKLHFFALDTISSLSFGESFSNLPKDEDVTGIVAENETGMVIIAFMMVMPWLLRLLERLHFFRLLSLARGNEIGFLQVDSLAQEKIDERFGRSHTSDAKTVPVEDKLDMMGSFIRHGVLGEQLKSETILQVLAGSDTTSTTIRVVMLHVLGNASIYQKLMAEILGTSSADKIISDAEARGMKYLQACIREGLRIQPPASTTHSKEVPEGGDYINGIFVPGGTSLGWSSRAMQRNQVLFGPDQGVYRPERWIFTVDGGDCESAEKLAQMVKVNELVFSYGRFKCLGQPVALIELNKVLTELFKRFDFIICNPKKPFAKDISVGSFIQTGMWVKVTRRQ